MTDRLQNTLLVAASLAALALGGAAIAGAASGSGSGSSGSNGSSSSSPARPGPRSGSLPPQRSDETLLSGETAAQVRAAALARVSGGTIERVETDADGHAAYEAHMRKADGSQVTVYVNKAFDVVAVEAGP